MNSSTNGLFIQSFDYRGVEDLPDHTFLQGSDKPDCSKAYDAYCQLPYYTAIYDLLPPEKSRWVPLPAPPTLPHPISVELLNREFSDDNELLNMTFAVRGGVDKLSLHITPLNNYQLKEFSFTRYENDILGNRHTYFVFMTYGYRPPENRERRFWVLLQRVVFYIAHPYNAFFQNTSIPNKLDPRKQPNLELVVATHQAHGT